jgi:hypothetical protein
MKIKGKKNSIAIEDDKLIYDDYKMASKKVTLYAKLSFEESSTSVLQGTFFTRSADKTSFTGTIRLEKKDDLAKTKLITQLEKMNLTRDLSFKKPRPTIAEDKTNATMGTTNESPSVVQPTQAVEIKTDPVAKEPGVLADLPLQKKPDLSIAALPVRKNQVKPFKMAAQLESRKTEIIRTIYFQSDSLVLNLYDNGEIDGDSVTVLVNGNLVIAGQALSTTPVRTTVFTPAGSGDSVRVVMYAENLGRIPPNTGLLIVEDGTEKYQVRFEGDFQKNSAIIFRRKH